MTHFVGLDVSQKMTAICVVDPAGNGIWRGGIFSAARACRASRHATSKSATPQLAHKPGSHRPCPQVSSPMLQAAQPITAHYASMSDLLHAFGAL
jgi:hypothetical protein